MIHLLVILIILMQESCISLSITSSSSSSTGGNDANLSLSIPQGGGIATGRHTVEVSSNNVAGYYVMLTGNAGSPAMTPSATTSQAFIQSTTGTLANPTYLDKGQWGSWGLALPIVLSIQALILTKWTIAVLTRMFYIRLLGQLYQVRSLMTATRLSLRQLLRLRRRIAIQSTMV